MHTIKNVFIYTCYCIVCSYIIFTFNNNFMACVHTILSLNFSEFCTLMRIYLFVCAGEVLMCAIWTQNPRIWFIYSLICVYLHILYLCKLAYKGGVARLELLFIDIYLFFEMYWQCCYWVSLCMCYFVATLAFASA